MHPPLLKLQDVNVKSRIQITKTLSTQHQIRMVAGPGEFTENSCRGIAFFLAFDPWQACWRFPPGSVRYFNAAKHQNLLSDKEAEQLSRILLQLATDISVVYGGTFSSYFSEPKVSNILSNLDELQHLSESGLAIADSWADRLFDACPTPLVPHRHFVVNSFRQVVTAGEIEFYSETPWLAWVEALDLACLGPWLGLKARDIFQMLNALRDRAINKVQRTIDVADDVLGHKVTLPIFSKGLQGFVSGVFYDVPKAQKEPILTSLLQFGETMGDVYANYRVQYLLEALETDLSDEDMARHIINIVSPIHKLIIERNGLRTGYKLQYEKSYFAGYTRLSADELEADLSSYSFFVDGPYGARIYVDPISDLPNLNPDFVRIQLESFLTHTIGTVSIATNSTPFSLADAQNLLAEHEPASKANNSSVAKLRQYYAAWKVHKHWDRGTVIVSNAELKGYLEDKLGREVSSGYQATSFVSEFEKIFSGNVTITKTRNAISISWNKKS